MAPDLETMPPMWHSFGSKVSLLGPLKVTLVGAQGAKRSLMREAATYIIMKPMLVEIRSLMDILVRSSMEMRDLFLKTGREEILITKGQRPWCLWKG